MSKAGFATSRGLLFAYLRTGLTFLGIFLGSVPAMIQRGVVREFCRVLLVMGIFLFGRGAYGALAGGQQPVQISDSRGRVLELHEAPARIASGCLASDEILWDILAARGGLSRLVAVSYLADDARYSNIASQVRVIPQRVGTNLESLLALRPDLVILASYNRPELVHTLEQAGITTFVLGGFERLELIAEHMRTLGRLTFEADEGERQAAVFLGELRALREKAQMAAARQGRIRVLSWSQDGTAAGQNTLLGSLIEAAGGDNLIASRGIAGWPRLSWELLATLDADWLVAPGEPEERATILATARKSAAYARMTASRKGQLVLVPARQLNAVSRHVLMALHALVGAFYPLETPGAVTVYGQAGPTGAWRL